MPFGPLPPKRYRIRWLARVPLGTSYNSVVEMIATVGEAAAHISEPTLMVDASGVGQPVIDMLRARTSLPLRAVTLTAGEAASQVGAYSWHLPKRDLVTSLEVVLQSRSLEVVPDCPLQADLQAELANFDFRIGDSGHTSFEAASGHSDDLVVSVALACWWLSRPSQGSAFLEMWTQLAILDQAERRGNT